MSSELARPDADGGRSSPSVLIIKDFIPFIRPRLGQFLELLPILGSCSWCRREDVHVDTQSEGDFLQRGEGRHACALFQMGDIQTRNASLGCQVLLPQSLPLPGFPHSLCNRPGDDPFRIFFEPYADWTDGYISDLAPHHSPNLPVESRPATLINRHGSRPEARVFFEGLR